MVERPNMQLPGDERTMLDRFLDFQRATIVLKAEGLDDTLREQLDGTTGE